MIATPIQIRFSDCDMGGHVHNAVYLNYFEIARVGFFVSGFGRDWDWKSDGLIVKKNVVEYNVPTFIADEISVEVNCTHIGNKSFTLSYAVVDGKGTLKASGESIIVSFDYKTQRTKPVTDRMRALLEAHYID